MSSSGPRTAPPQTLHARYYTDPAIFEEEKEKIFYRTWQCAGHIGELPDPGDFLVHTVIDEEVVVVRGDDETLRAFYNVCPHRAHRLLDGRGQCRATIVCPYHAWSFQLNGKLNRARRSDQVEGFDPSSIHLKQVRLEVFCGLIFINLDEEARPVAELVAHIEDDVRSFMPTIEALHFVGEVPIHHDSNWKVSIENYNECYHCRVVHPTSFSGVAEVSTYKTRACGATIIHHGEAEQPGEQYNYDPAHSERGGEFAAWFIWPNLAITCYPGGYASVRQWLPHNHQETVYLYRWFSDGSIPDEDVMALLETHSQTTGAEDAVLMGNIQRGLRSRGYQTGPLMVDANDAGEGEQGVAHLQSLLREALGLGADA